MGYRLSSKQATNPNTTPPTTPSAPINKPSERKIADISEALAPIAVRPLSTPVVTNVEATANRDPARVKDLLVEQVTAPVRWVEIVRFLVKSGVLRAYEIGPGKVLAGLARRIDRSLSVECAGEANDGPFGPATP